MSAKYATKDPKPRELRRRVMLRARMRSGAAWSDACILNVSSRGLLINAASGASPLLGRTIEVRHGDHVIVAEVVWSNGTRAGLRSEQRVPVNEILALSSAPSLQLTSSQWPQVERRKRRRTHEDNRVRGRALEFAGVGIIAIALGFGAVSLVHQAFAKPMAVVAGALGR